MLLKILTSRACDKLQELLEEERKVAQPFVHFLRRRMEVETTSDQWTKFKERFGCCGGIFRMAINIVQPVEDHEEDDDRIRQPLNLNQTPLLGGTTSNPGWMSLAMALSAERELRAEKHPARVSLMRLLEDTEEGADHDEGVDMVCCVCTNTIKGAAFVPCGHTFCRACASEVWVRRETCPRCNGKIHEVLRIY